MGLFGKPSSTDAQREFCLKMIRKPVANEARYARVWEGDVLPLADCYEMND